MAGVNYYQEMGSKVCQWTIGYPDLANILNNLEDDTYVQYIEVLW